jgi:NAD(P)H-flavin reductase
MIAGGTGLAPMLAMIDAIRARPGRKPKVLLSFGCQTPEGLFALDQLDLRRDWFPQLETRICVDRARRRACARAIRSRRSVLTMRCRPTALPIFAVRRA